VVVFARSSYKGKTYQSSPMTKHLKRFILVTALFAAVLVWIEQHHSTPALAQGQPGGYRNFEAPQVHPLAVTPDGTRLLAVNTPNNSLSVFHLTGRTLTLMAEIPVGLEPVSVAARNDREVWVTNWLSDSVSVVDLKTWTVTRTFEVGDEPTDIVFAGQQREMAFVCVSGLSQIKVFDPTAPATAPQLVAIRGKQPRALTRNADGSRVFVSVFESGNQTTTVPADVVSGGGGPPPPSPALKPGLPAPPPVGLIVKWNGSNWSDERGDGRWTSLIPFSLADVDVVVLDSSGAAAVLNREVRNVGTHIGNAVVDPTGNQLVVLNDEARNATRFEPNLKGRFLNTRVSLVGLGNTNVAAVDLNQHIDYGNLAGNDAERALSLAQPADIVRATDGTFYVAATGSAKVGVLDSAGSVLARVAVGQGPTGLALNPRRKLLYVLNRFDDSLSIVDTITKAQIATVPVGFNPEPAAPVRGRRFLYDATLSAHGDLSCASCHANGHRDGIAWDLGDPTGDLQVVNNPLGGPFGVGQSIFHPMKGPMTTQSLRGIIGTGPLHWRGDRAGLANFNPAFVSLLGGPRLLTAAEMNDFQAFIQTLSYPPNPNQNLDRTLPNPPAGPSAARGALLFNNNFLDANIFTCNQCHTANPGFGPGTNGALIPAIALDESQDFKVPQLRGLYQKTGFFRAPGEQVTGYGFLHDGSTDTLFSFLHASVFTFQNDAQRRDIEQFVLSFDSGIAPAVGSQVTVDADNKASAAVTNRINLLQAQASAGNCELVVRGLYNGTPRGFLYNGNGQYQTDKLGEPPVPLATLLQAAGVRAELTFTGVPLGAGRRNAIDRNGNGILNGNEPLTPNALDSAQFFVWHHYRDFLSRDPDTAGLDYWTSQITNCGTDAACIHSQRIGVSAAFFIELEFQETGYVVYRMYRGAYGSRAAAPARADVNFAQFIADRSLIVGGSGLPQSTIDYANTFVARPEFTQKYPAGAADAFVNNLYSTAGLGGAEFAAQRQAAIDGLNAATKTRAQVLLDLIEIQQFKDREYNPAFVLMQYFGYLRRDPDQGGYDFWLNILNGSQPRNFRGMVCSFITSTEYQLRFGPSVTRSNQDCSQ
jgi:YVTN family beta-propeller protein